MDSKPKIKLDPKDVMILAAIAKTSSGDHNNSQINHQEIEEVNIDSRLRAVEYDVREIKSNYLTSSTFYKISGSALITLIVSAGVALWAVYSSLDNKIANLADRTDKKFELVDQRFQQVEDKIHSVDIRLTKVESQLDNVEKKLDGIDDKIDILIQQMHTSK